MELFAWNVALVLTAYAWIRFCDNFLKPWSEARTRNRRLAAACAEVDMLHALRARLDDTSLTSDEVFAVDERIADVMARLRA